ncbi:MAG TPA: carbohydrate ABC transporter permease [Candidatus Brocadiia bacterium]|nr:carbohydrate ABC transporter permease [Candidatus Brocadiia bacterium]
MKKDTPLPFRGLAWTLLLAGAFTMLYPYLWMVGASLKPMSELNTPNLLPKNIVMEQYGKLWAMVPIATYFKNSVIVTLSTVAVKLILCSLAGYAFAKHRFPGRDGLFLVLLVTMMIPAGVSIIPNFIIMSRLGWTNTYWALIVPNAADAFSIFLARQYMLGIPDDILEAARIDGASETYVFWRIVLPLATPVLGALGIITFLGAWNDFFGPFIYFNEESVFTLPVGLAKISVPRGDLVQGIQMAGSFLITLPVVGVFLLLQRYFVAGMTAGALKE